MSAFLINSMASPFTPTMRTVWQVDGNDAALLAYLQDNHAPHSTGNYSIARSGGVATLSWDRWRLAPSPDGTVAWVLDPAGGGRLQLPPAGGYVIASSAQIPTCPAVFDTAGWWPCDSMGNPLDSRVLQSPQKVSRTRVAIGRATLTSGVYLASSSPIDVPIVFDSPPPVVPESGWVQVQPGVIHLGKTRAVIKDGSITAAGCTITVNFLAPVTFSAVQPATYEAVCLYTFLADA